MARCIASRRFRISTSLRPSTASIRSKGIASSPLAWALSLPAHKIRLRSPTRSQLPEHSLDDRIAKLGSSAIKTAAELLSWFLRRVHQASEGFNIAERYILAEIAFENRIQCPLQRHTQFLLQARQLHQVHRPPQHKSNYS